jgi:DNA-directed RNA polymerase specialized sigma24 family protein
MAKINGSRPSQDRAGEASFERQFEDLRPKMYALAYRITGSRPDSEDIVQDAFLRLRTAASSEEIRSMQAYLTTITTRLSLNRLRALRTQRKEYVGEWLPEPLPTAGDPLVLASNVPQIRSWPNCYPCLRKKMGPMYPGRTLKSMVGVTGFEPATPTSRT